MEEIYVNVGRAGARAQRSSPWAIKRRDQGRLITIHHHPKLISSFHHQCEHPHLKKEREKKENIVSLPLLTSI